MPNYVIHIGAPKTATKYLQNGLYELRETLNADGIAYPDDLWTSRAHFSHEQLLWAIKTGSNTGIEAMFHKYNESSYKTVLISCEGFTSLNKDEIRYLKKLTNNANAKIVYYCRRWSDWIPSAWEESVRQGSCETFPEALVKLMRAPFHEQEINFGILLDRFADVFAKENIIVGSYSNVMDAKENILDNFLVNVLNITCDISRITGSMNMSLGVAETELVRALNVIETTIYGSIKWRFEDSFVDIRKDAYIKDMLETLKSKVKNHIGEIVIDDASPWLTPAYHHITERYGDQLIKNGPHILFNRQSRAAQYVRSTYLFDEYVLGALRRVHSAARNYFTDRR